MLGYFLIHLLTTVLGYHDLLGMLQHLHHAKVHPLLCSSIYRMCDFYENSLSKFKKRVAENGPGRCCICSSQWRSYAYVFGVNVRSKNITYFTREKSLTPYHKIPSFAYDNS